MPELIALNYFINYYFCFINRLTFSSIPRSSNGVGSSHEVNTFVVIGAIINLVVVGGHVHLWVPGEVNGPGVLFPLSHLVVELDWGVGSLWFSHPVHDVVIIGRVIDALWPWSSPVVSVHMDWWSFNTGLEGHHINDVVRVVVVNGFNTSKEDNCESIFHFCLKLL